jgi:hypothetical protein
VHKVAKLSATVLILGESGTGKELLARLIHRDRRRATRRSSRSTSRRSRASWPRARSSGTSAARSPARTGSSSGKFELASNGTLFLDEIGDLRLDLQAKLLRAIQEGEIERVGGTKPIKTDFRLIAATNVDLEKAVKEGRFREDLYYRINVIPIKLPPLRERPTTSRSWPSSSCGATTRGSGSGSTGITDSTMAHAEEVLVAGQHPRAGEPDRAARRGQRQGVHLGGGPAARVPLRPARAAARGGRDAVPGGDQHLRAQLHPAGAREVRLERHRDTAEYLGVPLSTLKYKMDKLDVRAAPRREAPACAAADPIAVRSAHAPRSMTISMRSALRWWNTRQSRPTASFLMN